MICKTCGNELKNAGAFEWTGEKMICHACTNLPRLSTEQIKQAMAGKFNKTPITKSEPHAENMRMPKRRE